MANKIFSLAEFFTPSYSAFPQPHEVKISHEIGNLNVVDYYDLGPGDSIDIKMQQLTRFAPLAAPTMHNFKLDFHAISVPYRLAMPLRTMSYMDGFESFFNLSLSDSERPLMPTFESWEEYLQALSAYAASHNVIGSLFDQLQYPIFADLFRKIEDNNNLQSVMNSGFVEKSTFTVPESYISYQGFDIDFAAPEIDVTYGDDQIVLCTFPGYLWALLSGIGNNFSYYEDQIAEFYFDDEELFPDSYGWTQRMMLGNLAGIGVNDSVSDSQIIEAALQKLGLKYTEAMDRFVNFMYGYILYKLGRYIQDTQGPQLNLLPIYAYWTAVYDWYINTNLQTTTDKATWLTKYLNLSTRKAKTAAWLPFRRYWTDDYFTSAFQSTDMPDEAIPINGTIPQLRSANSLQELKERVLYAGKRYMDQILAIFGVHTNADRFDRSQVVGSASFNINISEVLQQSQSTEYSNLADMAGHGLSVGSDSFVKHKASEHEILLVFMSVKPTAIYDQQVPKLLFKQSPYDFLVPQLANVGEQEILPYEIYPSLGLPETFGYTRRYAEYMFTPSHVSGEFRTSLDYWHASRHFDEQPVLNEDFCQIRPADGYNRIFAVPGANEHVYTFIYFDTVISRPLSRTIHYHL